jgi:hypothetical protein
MEVFMDETTNMLYVKDRFTGQESKHYDISRSRVWRGAPPGPKELSSLIGKCALEVLQKAGK